MNQVLEIDGQNLNRARPLRDQIYQIVRSMIVTGQLRPGETVNEIAIAQTLGTSRTPVREAVKRISDEGMVSVLAQSGTFVTPISIRDIEEAYMIRSALESECAKRAADKITQSHIEMLEDNIEAHALALSRRKIIDVINFDDTFHRTIAEINGYHMVWRAVDISKAQMDRGRYLAIPTQGNGERSVAQHRQILKHLQRRDAEGAAAAMREHLNTSLKATIEAVASSLR